MLEIMQKYLEICAYFNTKLEEIKADEILNTNLELVKASITDLDINISNFKSDLQYNAAINQANQAPASLSEFDRKSLLAFFFMYLMQIDKDSIINKSSITSITSNSTLNSIVSNVSTANANNVNKKMYDYPDPEVD